MDAGLGHTLHPGPIDDSVLTLQDHHRSTDIWNGQDFEPLTCRRCDGHFWRLGALDPRVQKMLLKAGFYGVYKAGRIRLDHALITALVERWRPETHTFHFPVGEATVTLQDISVLWGLPVDGDPITGIDTNRTMDEWQEICNELLGFRPPPEDFDRGRLKIRCLQERFKTLPDDATEDIVKFYARAYILQLLGGQLLSDMSNNKVKLMYLPLLRDFEAAGNLSWGNAVLACLYRALCRATKPETSDICGPLVLLQIWAWERIPFIRPGRLAPQQQPSPDIVAGEHHLPAAPYGSRWNVGFKLESVGTHVLVLYRDQLDNMKDNEFIWEPYPFDVLASLPEYCLSGKSIWQTVAPLICFDVVEFHHPDRVVRQFGQYQTIPAVCDTIPDIHLTDRRGRQNYDWANHHRQFVDMWTDRCARVICGPPLDCPMDQSDPYMVWYRQITRLLIGNPATRPNTRYHGVGGSNEAMVQSLQKIYHRATEAMNEGYEVSGEDALREIQDLCAYSLRGAHEDHRLTVHPELGSPYPATSSFVPPKVQRGRPRKRGGFAAGQVTESRKRGSYVPGTPSSSFAVSHSPMPSSNMLPPNVGEMVGTPQTWDSSMSVSEFQDTLEPNTMQLDPEGAETANPFFQALGKIRDICAYTLRTSSGDPAMFSTQEMIPSGPKTKRCRPRRRGGMTGYFAGASSGVNSYYQYTPGQASPTPSASLGFNSSPSHALDIPEQNFEQTLVTPLERDSPISELHDNLQSEMIELDNITGSREPSPSMLELPCYSPGNQNSLLPSTDNNAPISVTESEENREGNEVISPSDSFVQNVKPEYYEPSNFNEVLSLQANPIESGPSIPETKLHPAYLNPDGVATDVNGTADRSTPEVPLDIASPAEKEDSKLSTEQNDQNTPELSPIHPALSKHPVSDEPITNVVESTPPTDIANSAEKDSKSSVEQIDKTTPEPSPKNPALSENPVSDEPITNVDGAKSDDVIGVGGKRKGEVIDKASSIDSSHVLDTTVMSCHDPDTNELSVELESGVTKADLAAMKDDGQKKYKRQRRSVPKHK